MSNELSVINERADDIPLLLGHMDKMGVIELINTHFSVHGNWEGLSMGEVVAGWLAHILSEGDHRMSRAETWATHRERVLSGCLGQPVIGGDFSDDRLSIVLRTLSDDASWQAFEGEMNGQLLRVYRLESEVVRIDTTTCSGYGDVNEEGLFQFGHSKDHRPDLPQVKVALATLDPLGMPLAADVVAGQRADDPLYLPIIKRVRESLEREGLLYVGDSKMGALATRATLAYQGDHYLCPLSRVQLSDEELTQYLQPVWDETQAVDEIHRTAADGKTHHIATGYELTLTRSAEVEGETITWQERHLVVRSMRQVKAAETRLTTTLTNAKAALKGLNERGRGKRRYQTIDDLRATAQTLMDDYGVSDLLKVTYDLTTTERQVRAYGDRPARTETQTDATLAVTVNDEAVTARLQRAGWRVYATNTASDHLPLHRAVLAYRDQYIIERGCGRLKGKPLSVTPMYLERDDHATGLIRLLTIGLRVLTLLEFEVRRRLAEANDTLSGIYPGNPKRATPRPSAELMLTAFDNITFSIVHVNGAIHYHITDLSPTQRRILALLGFTPTLYTSLPHNSSIPP